MGKKLHVGAYKDVRPGWVNHDRIKLPGIDVVHDLDVYPWPWKTGEFEEVYIAHCLEHLRDPVAATNELLRITKLGGRVEIRVPFWNSPNAFDTCHRTYFGLKWFDGLQNMEPIKYPYKVISAKGTPALLGKLIPPIPIPRNNGYTLRDYMSGVLGSVYWEMRYVLERTKTAQLDR